MSLLPFRFPPLLFEALTAARGMPASAECLTRLGNEYGSETARWAIEQWDLRKRAKAKFERAEEMLFDREGLEMASSEKLARFNATQFPSGERVADLTCGIGADLMALAGRGPAIGYEVNPDRAAMAEHNLRVYGLEADIRCEDCLAAAWDFEFAFADPSRRTEGRRLLDPEDYLPNPIALAERMKVLTLGTIKLSPMLTDDFLNSLSSNRDFVSIDGECREVLLRIEPSGTEDVRATKIGVGGLAGETAPPASVEVPSRLFLEADPAAIRAHALGDLCERLSTIPLGDSNGYLTCDALESEWAKMHLGWVDVYEVAGFGKADEKRIRQELRKLDGQVVAVKVRGVREDPVAWQKKLKSEGKRPLVLALYPVEKSVRFVLITRR